MRVERLESRQLLHGGAFGAATLEERVENFSPMHLIFCTTNHENCVVCWVGHLDFRSNVWILTVEIYKLKLQCL